ncbi:MAG: hypothetical protein WD738_11780 [Pirellulales bacterium]
MIRRTVITALFCTLIAAASGPPSQAAPRGADGKLEIEVVDSETGQPIAARMHLKNSRGRPVKLNLPNAAEFGGHFYIDGRITLPLRRGQYTFDLDAGPEYRPQTGHFEIERHADDTKRIEMKRFANLAEEGWWAGDLDVRRPPRDMPLIVRAEGLQDIRISDFGLRIADSGDQSAIRSSTELAEGNPQSEIKIARVPYAWDLPVWLARDQLAAIQLIHHHALRDGVVDNEDDGRPRDLSLFPGRSGNARWSETVYYHVLNCGLRIPPAAGSGSGDNENPVGTNRVYVFCGDKFSADEWWEGLQAGQIFVTNGPLLRPLVEGHPPGYVFHLEPNGSLTLEIGLDLATRVPIEYLQIIKNGSVEADVRLADWANRKGRLPPLIFDDSGWFLVRAVTNNQHTYQFASSGPYYVEESGRPRISRRSVQFFLDWIDAAKQRLAEMPALDQAARQSLLAQQDTAEEFFTALLTKANAD